MLEHAIGLIKPVSMSVAFFRSSLTSLLSHSDYSPAIFFATSNRITVLSTTAFNCRSLLNFRLIVLISIRTPERHRNACVIHSTFPRSRESPRNPELLPEDVVRFKATSSLSQSGYLAGQFGLPSFMRVGRITRCRDLVKLAKSLSLKQYSGPWRYSQSRLWYIVWNKSYRCISTTMSRGALYIQFLIGIFRILGDLVVFGGEICGF